MNTYYPPRAKTKYSQRVGYRVKKWLAAVQKFLPQASPFPDSVKAAFLSIIPGLGHYYVRGRFVSSLIYFAIFIILVNIRYALTDTWPAAISFTILISYHCSVIYSAYTHALRKLNQPIPNTLQSIKISLLITIFVVLLYAAFLPSIMRVTALVYRRTYY